MNANKLELLGLVSLTVCSIAAVGFATGARTGTPGIAPQMAVVESASLIASAHASQLESVDNAKPKTVAAPEQAPIYLDLGAKF